MTNGNPVDIAMEEDSPAKERIRLLWVDKVQQRAGSFDNEHPIYLSMMGRNAKDLEALVEAGVVRLNSVEGISDDDLRKVVAIESSPPSVVALQRRYPGLKIIEKDVASLVRFTGPYDWPTNKERNDIAAAVLNLDFNAPFRARVVGGEAQFPQLGWIAKLSQIQRDLAVFQEWTLCLTLNASPNWDGPAQEAMTEIVARNGDDHPTFRDRLEALFTDQLVAAVDARAELPAGITQRESQALLCVLVPKLIAERLVPQGWSLTVEWSLGYESVAGAPMVTFIIDVERAHAGPTVFARLRTSITTFTNGVGRVEEDGDIQTDD